MDVFTFTKRLYCSLRNHPDDWEVSSGYLRHRQSGIHMLLAAIMEHSMDVVIFGPDQQRLACIPYYWADLCYQHLVVKPQREREKQARDEFLKNFEGF